jgi:hypothetical protein
VQRRDLLVAWRRSAVATLRDAVTVVFHQNQPHAAGYSRTVTWRAPASSALSTDCTTDAGRLRPTSPAAIWLISSSAGQESAFRISEGHMR